MNSPKVTAHTFAQSSDAEIIAAAREVLAGADPSKLRPAHRRLLRTRKPDVMVAGKFLWAYLCRWPSARLFFDPAYQGKADRRIRASTEGATS